MGLDTTHEAWHGAYSSFNYWRKAVASAAGIDLEKMWGFSGEKLWESLPPDPLHTLLNHSDCDGEIAWSDCGPIADRLAEVLPKLPEQFRLRENTQQFIDGCRRAFEAKENLEFH